MFISVADLDLFTFSHLQSFLVILFPILSLQDAAAQRCPVGVPGLQFVDDWRSWKAEEGDIVQGEEERCKVGT